MGINPWVPDVLVRAAAGWALDWGERAVYEALAFRAELWCTSEDMLVHHVWHMAQNMSGRTFAAESYRLLHELQLPEITSMEGWTQFIEDRRPILPVYKKMLRKRLEQRSSTAWKLALQVLPGVGAHQLAQHYPCSIGFRLLEEGYLSHLYAAAAFDLLRIGAVNLSLAIPGVEDGVAFCVAVRSMV